jgi:hypothetical protein
MTPRRLVLVSLPVAVAAILIGFMVAFTPGPQASTPMPTPYPCAGGGR